jgi:uncharacterized membrane protein YjfL (UPF0719 family)
VLNVFVSIFFSVTAQKNKKKMRLGGSAAIDFTMVTLGVLGAICLARAVRRHERTHPPRRT